MRKIYLIRSRLMPYIYSLAHNAYEKGEPMIASLYIEYPEDENAYRSPQEYFFGKAFLCAPVTEPMKNGKASQRVYIPEGLYHHFFTGERFGAGEYTVASPLDEFPLFVRAGVPIPMQKETNRMTERTPEDLTVRIYTGADGEFTLYEDDGVSAEYQSGAYLKTHFVYTEKNGTFSLTVTPEGKGYEGMPPRRAYTVEIIGLQKPLRALNMPEAEISFDGNKHTVLLPTRTWNEGFALLMA